MCERVLDLIHTGGSLGIQAGAPPDSRAGQHAMSAATAWLSVFLALCLGLAAGACRSEQAPLSVRVITTSEASLYSNCTLVIGASDMVLIDPPFTNADAHRVVADMLETGRNLTTVFVTHDHPDHFWGMQVIMDAFPGAKVIAHPTVVADIWRSIPFKIKRWGPVLGRNGPAYPTAPLAWDKDHFELEGQRLDILGPMQGDHVHATAVHIPSLDTLVAGDMVFHGIHVWLAEHTAERRRDWIESLDELAGLDAATVVAGHKLPHLGDDASALSYTREYILDFDREARQAKHSEALIARMRKLYPDVQDVLNDFILPNSARVGVGEEAPWQE
jgi:glyoxylase-like metal-dependent hydrolase (beta-lactamase superfamily II)